MRCHVRFWLFYTLKYQPYRNNSHLYGFGVLFRFLDKQKTLNFGLLKASHPNLISMFCRSHKVPSFYLDFQFCCKVKFHLYGKTLLLPLLYISLILNQYRLQAGQKQSAESIQFCVMIFLNSSATRLQLL